MLLNRVKTKNVKQGFTFVEFLLVIAAIAILMIVLVEVIRPDEKLAATRNTERRADVNTILNAVYQYALDHSGQLPSAIKDIPLEICKTNAEDCSDLADLSVLTKDEKYLYALPVDPIGESADGTGYEILRTPGGRVNVIAPYAELGIKIDVYK
ncbi:hypothetical protein A2V54_02020 [candidate division WWE3 bacterium RBG_19FT_COMBO_53_11]|uniref:Type II secretion system protein GspG C-terminal domain-containing protein n=1 Tax=candidate division WWE3 bacterium RBG_19FT_COMBO_53_11 TaxID=1802613 RepID=A0A1F4UHZ6_UNCKA|nr:MAG: hypothetical protein A2155_01130 [candidate division WWE3 bacterium RBG_16_52_45]OGC44527.1 MAG: hypothetical protein A2V54_02020 [candidate division WWE3 bacterium RBG_19FT_COMBO_53_11]